MATKKNEGQTRRTFLKGAGSVLAVGVAAVDGCSVIVLECQGNTCEGCDGSGVKMAMAAGAALSNMNECWGYPA